MFAESKAWTGNNNSYPHFLNRPDWVGARSLLNAHYYPVWLCIAHFINHTIIIQIYYLPSLLPSLISVLYKTSLHLWLLYYYYIHLATTSFYLNNFFTRLLLPLQCNNHIDDQSHLGRHSTLSTLFPYCLIFHLQLKGLWVFIVLSVWHHERWTAIWYGFGALSL